MRCEQFKDLKLKKLINDGPVSMVYQLDDGRYIKLIAKDFLDHYAKNGIYLEDKILESENIKDVPELVLPQTAVYLDKRFCGYTLEEGNGLSYPQYLNSLTCYEYSDIDKLTKIFLNIEELVKKGWKQDLVFPDLFNGKNVLIDELEGIQLIDFDGVQYKEHVADSVSTIIYASSKSDKYRNGILWTPEIDKKSLVYIYYSMVLGVSLSQINLLPVGRNSMIKILLDSIGLEDDAIYEKTCATLSDSAEGYLIGDDVSRVAQEYRIALYECDGQYKKRLVRK